MGRRGPETRVVDTIRTAILALWPSAFITKIHGGPYQQGGLPDLIGCLDGYFFGIEVKTPEAYARPNHNMTALQQHTLLLIEESGGIAGCVCDATAAVNLLKQGKRARDDQREGTEA